MVKSLGEFNIGQSSSSDINNIKWSQKNTNDEKKPKKKKKFKVKTPFIQTSKKSTKEEPITPKVFKIQENAGSDKAKKKKTNKKFEKSDLSNCKIEQGYRRPGR